jgi:perosamine synthetase
MEKIKLFNVVKTEEIETSVLSVLRSGQLSSGEIVSQFERCFSRFNASDNVVACSDMTSALELIFKIAGIGLGDEVIATPFACLSTNSAIVTSGASAVWVDNGKNSLFMDFEDIERKITEKTKALVLYHIAGYICNVEKIAMLCDQKGILLIEDCNNALGASYKNKKVGNFGDYSIFSFYPNRFLHCIEGAMIVCKEVKNANLARKLRRFGIDYESFRDSDGEINKFSDVSIICNSKVLSNLNAAVGIAQFSQLENKLTIVKSNLGKLKFEFEQLSGIEVLTSDNDANGVPWVMFLLVEQRDMLLRHLKEHGIEVSKVHCRNDYYSGFGDCNRVTLSNLDSIEKRLIGIPCGWWISESELAYMVKTIKSWIYSWR